jgi:hypothetical protein
LFVLVLAPVLLLTQIYVGPFLTNLPRHFDFLNAKKYVRPVVLHKYSVANGK